LTLNISDLIRTIALVLSGIASLIAIFIAIKSENRNAKRFEAGLEAQKEIAEKSLIPILTVYYSENIDFKRIELFNAGIGTAIINKVALSKNGKSVKSLHELFELPNKIKWDSYWTFEQNKYYLSAGKSFHLVELSEKNLMDQGFNKTEISNILDLWQKQMDGIKIEILYEDIFGKNSYKYERVLPKSPY
jgi:hypothetical protein